MNRITTILIASLTVCASLAPAFGWAPLGTGLTYQGQLKSGGSPANGSYNLEFRLFDALAGGNQLGSAQTLNSVSVANGLFTVQLNTAGEFGASAFDGSRRWLEIRVNGTPLSPRQELTAAPYALFALSGPAGSGPWQLNGTNAYYNNGNVGVGTNLPGMSLEVSRPSYYGKPAIGAADGASYAYLHVTSSADNSLIWDSARAMRFGTETSRGTGYVERVRIAADGKVGINTSSPTARLSVNPSGDEGINVSTILGSLPLIHATDTALFSFHGTADCIVGEADNGYGVRGDSYGNDGVFGQTHSSVRSGVWGNNDAAAAGGHGVTGSCNNGIGVYGQSNTSFGVYGTTNSTTLNVAGVYGQAIGNGQVVGVYGYASTGVNAAGVVGVGATGGYFASNGLGSNTALWANGLCKVGTLQILGGADLAEPFDVNGEGVKPGMVVVIDPANPGKLRPCQEAFDRKVAGIISGAGGVATGLSMGHEGTIAHGKHPVALTGRVYCLVDASQAPVEPGDLLTTSTVAGHAMKACDTEKARGAILGKAMTRLAGGKGLVLVLVNLQ